MTAANKPLVGRCLITGKTPNYLQMLIAYLLLLAPFKLLNFLCKHSSHKEGWTHPNVANTMQNGYLPENGNFTAWPCHSFPSLVGTEVFGGYAVCSAVHAYSTVSGNNLARCRSSGSCTSAGSLQTPLVRASTGERIQQHHIILHDLTPSCTLLYPKSRTQYSHLNTESHMDPPSHHWAQHSHSLTQHSHHGA